MARVKLQLPSTFQYKTDLSVRVSDINYGGHLGNDAVLGLIHEARFRFLNRLGYESEMTVENAGILIADSVIIYKSEAFHGDILDIHISVGEYNAYGFDIFYLLINRDSGREVARAKTGIVCMDRTSKKVTRTPEKLIQRVQELEPYTI